jgi:hypothetical protein
VALRPCAHGLEKCHPATCKNLLQDVCCFCSKKNPVGNAQKGSKKSIVLLNWQSRFELDLMVFSKLRKRDPFGVLMRWILTLKDHATALVYL